jgi:DNA modification methylase
VSTSALRRNPRNARRHSDRQIAQIAASIQNFGFLVPILADEENTLIAGHGRLSAAEQIGITDVPVVRINHLSEAQKRAYALADNRLAELSDWDPELLKLEIEELSALELPFDLEITGFDTVELDRILGSVAPAHDPADALPEHAHAISVSRPGNIWEMGDHRLICGDATRPETYTALLETTKAQMVFTDPPYNVPISGHVSSRAIYREFPMASGEMSPQEFAAFLERCARLVTEFSERGAVHYVCMDWRHQLELLIAARAVYGEPKQVCVWVKDNAGMGSFYRSQHELVFVFKVGDLPHINNFGLGERGRYRTNVWHYPGVNSAGGRKDSVDHPTVKPVALVADAIRDCSRRGGLILDPFGGSGTTLMAAERTDRCARLAELDPLYVDLIVRRWQALTGGRATQVGSGRQFDEFESEVIDRERAHGTKE